MSQGTHQEQAPSRRILAIMWLVCGAAILFVWIA